MEHLPQSWRLAEKWERWELTGRGSRAESSYPCSVLHGLCSQMGPTAWELENLPATFGHGYYYDLYLIPAHPCGKITLF